MPPTFTTIPSRSARRGPSILSALAWALLAWAWLGASAPAQGPPDYGYKGSVELTAEEKRWLASNLPRLAPYGNYPPGEFIDENGQHKGIAADYVRLVERRLGVAFERVVFDNWEEILHELRLRNADMVALAAESPERLEYLIFTEPYLEFPAVILARADHAGEIAPEDLAGAKVAVGKGYSVNEYLRANYPEVELSEVRDSRIALRQASLGLADAAIADLSAASYFIEQEGITNLRVAGETGYVYRMGFACRSDWPVWRGILRKALASITPAEREAIYRKWISLGGGELFDSELFWRALVPSVASGLLLLAAMLFWARGLRRQVAQRAAELEELNASLERRVAERSEELERHVQLLSHANRRMKKDLEAAAKVQRRFLPSEPPEIEGFRAAWSFAPCEYIGGDLLNVFRVDSSRWAFFILDVSGHGVPAALLSVSLSRALAPPLSPEDSPWGSFRRASAEDLASPERAARLVNSQFLKDADPSMFCSLLYAVLDVRDHTVEWVRAGHEPPLVIRAGGDVSTFHEEPSGPALGLMPSDELDLRAGFASLKPGDRFVIYSDGVTESFRGEEMFGKARLAGDLCATAKHPLGASLAGALRASAEWSGQEAFDDDVTIFALERKQPGTLY